MRSGPSRIKVTPPPTIEGATLRRAAFHVNGSGSAEWRALANTRKHRKTLGYKRQCKIFLNQYRRTVRFRPGHQLGCSSRFESVRNRPRSAQKPLKNRRFRVHRCSSPFVLIRSQPSDLLVFLLVSCWYRENKRSRRLSLFRTKELSRWPARTMARALTTSRPGPTSTAAPADRNSTRACGVLPRFPT